MTYFETFILEIFFFIVKDKIFKGDGIFLNGPYVPEKRFFTTLHIQISKINQLINTKYTYVFKLFVELNYFHGITY